MKEKMALPLMLCLRDFPSEQAHRQNPKFKPSLYEFLLFHAKNRKNLPMSPMKHK